ncbi:MAG: enoyl-CoA hydratase/isomerase family protein [Opitutaceae bacterium]
MTNLDTDEVVSYSCEDGVGFITFNRPPANAYHLEFYEAFIAAIESADTDTSARVVIIRSTLDRFFCVGADIKVFAKNSIAENKQMVAAAQRALALIEASSKVFIACLQGHALGGGLEIAMACDVRFAAEGQYKLGLPETLLGLLPGNGGSQRLPRLVGPSHAIGLLASGESIEPAEALRIGLVNRLYPQDEVVAATISFAQSIAKAAPLAVAAAKKAVGEGIALPLKEALELESRLVEDLYATEDAKEGFNAFVEKRPPVYKGR